MASHSRIQYDFSSNSSASQDRSAAASFSTDGVFSAGGRGNVFGSNVLLDSSTGRATKNPDGTDFSVHIRKPAAKSVPPNTPSRHAFGANAFARSMPFSTPNKTTGATSLAAATAPPKETRFAMYGDAPATVGAGADKQSKLGMRKMRCQELSVQNGLGKLSSEEWEKMGRPKPREFLDRFGLHDVSATPITKSTEAILSPFRAAASKLSAHSPYHGLTQEQRGKLQVLFQKKGEKNDRRRAFLSESNNTAKESIALVMKNSTKEDELAAQEDQDLEEQLQMILAESRDESGSDVNRQLFSKAGDHTAEGSREDISTPGAATDTSANSSSGTAQRNASSSGAANGHVFNEGEPAWYSQNKQMDAVERVTIVKVHYDHQLEPYYDLSNDRQTDNDHLVTIEQMEAFKRQGV